MRTNTILSLCARSSGFQRNVAHNASAEPLLLCCRPLFRLECYWNCILGCRHVVGAPVQSSCVCAFCDLTPHFLPNGFSPHSSMWATGSLTLLAVCSVPFSEPRTVNQHNWLKLLSPINLHWDSTFANNQGNVRHECSRSRIPPSHATAFRWPRSSSHANTITQIELFSWSSCTDSLT